MDLDLLNTVMELASGNPRIVIEQDSGGVVKATMTLKDWECTWFGTTVEGVLAGLQAVVDRSKPWRAK